MNFSINMEQVLIGNRQEMIQRYWEKLKHMVLGLCHQLNIINLIIKNDKELVPLIGSGKFFCDKKKSLSLSHRCVNVQKGIECNL